MSDDRLSRPAERLVLPREWMFGGKECDIPERRNRSLVARVPAQTNDRRQQLPRCSDRQGDNQMPAKKKSKTSKRTVIEPRKGDRRYVRRNKKGEFKKEVKVGTSLAADRKRKAKSKVKKGQGDRGDVKR